MNLGQLIEACEYKSGFNDSAYRPRWINFLNEALRDFARRQPWAGLEDTVDLTTDGTKYLVLPQYVDTVVSILNMTDKIPVDRSGNYDREATYEETSGTTGRVCNYETLGDVPVLRDPTGYVWFKSSHASDIQTVYFTGLATNSGASGTALSKAYTTLSIQAAGVSPVTCTTLFASFISVAKSTDSNGDFFFYDAGDSDKHVSFISKHETDARFRRLKLFYPPNATKSIRVRFRHYAPPLRDNAQSPHPSVKPDFLINYAIARHWGEQEQLQKEQLADNNATRLLEREVNKDTNFNEPDCQIIPWRPFSEDESDDFYRSVN